MSEHNLIHFAIFPVSRKFVNSVEAASQMLTNVLNVSACESTRHKLNSYILILFYFSTLSSESEHLFDKSVLTF
jgi:hypothetical protein